MRASRFPLAGEGGVQREAGVAGALRSCHRHSQGMAQQKHRHQRATPVGSNHSRIVRQRRHAHLMHPLQICRRAMIMALRSPCRRHSLGTQWIAQHNKRHQRAAPVGRLVGHRRGKHPWAPHLHQCGQHAVTVQRCAGTCTPSQRRLAWPRS